MTNSDCDRFVYDIKIKFIFGTKTYKITFIVI